MKNKLKKIDHEKEYIIGTLLLFIACLYRM